MIDTPFPGDNELMTLFASHVYAVPALESQDIDVGIKFLPIIKFTPQPIHWYTGLAVNDTEVVTRLPRYLNCTGMWSKFI